MDPWIMTRSGTRVDLFEPLPEQLVLADIAYSLSMQCRWSGHTSIYYSVAQHSVLCSWYTSANFALAALMHDASEAYTGDIIRPIKRGLGEDFHGMEDTIMEALAEKFNFQFPLPPEVKQADEDMLETEWRKLMNQPNQFTKIGRHHETMEFMSWSPTVAYKLFMGRFNVLSTNANLEPTDMPIAANSQLALWHERYPLLTDEEKRFVSRMQEL